MDVILPPDVRRNITAAAWALFLLFLPLTNFPLFPPELGGAMLVRPLSVYPLLALLPLVTLPRLFTQPLPRTFQALAPFILIAVTSSALSLVNGINSNFGVSVPERLLRTLITLAVGVAIYVTVALLPRSWRDLRGALRWMYAGFGFALFWGSLQAAYIIRFSPSYFNRLSEIQRFFTTRRLFPDRVSGLTYEPNWFAEQIGFLLLPWLFAAVMSRHTVFSRRWRWVSVELLMLAWAVLILIFTFSRMGIVVLAAEIGLTVLLFLFSNYNARSRQKEYNSRSIFLRVSIVVIVIVVVASLVGLAGTRNEFFTRLWQYWITEEDTSLAGYMEHLGFGARLSYGAAAYNMYEAHPIFGVGLGNYAFYFEEMMPYRPLVETPEILRLLSVNVIRFRLMTPKSLYVRILAEMGILGMGTFLVFLVALLGCALFLFLSPKREEKFWGTAGIYTLVAFLFAAWSFDSFAIPNMWVSFGLITAAAWLNRAEGVRAIEMETSQ